MSQACSSGPCWVCWGMLCCAVLCCQQRAGPFWGPTGGVGRLVIQCWGTT